MDLGYNNAGLVKSNTKMLFALVIFVLYVYVSDVCAVLSLAVYTIIAKSD